MCRLVFVGVTGGSGDPHGPFRAAGFTTRLASNPSCAALPATSVRIEVTTGTCSCDFYCGDTRYVSVDPEAARRRYERKGWSKAKIERALESRQKRHARTRPIDLGAQFAAAVETLVKGGAHVTLLAHDFDGLFIEPFEIVGTTQIPFAHYVARGNYFPEDTLVSLLT